MPVAASTPHLSAAFRVEAPAPCPPDKFDFDFCSALFAGLMPAGPLGVAFWGPFPRPPGKPHRASARKSGNHFSVRLCDQRKGAQEKWEPVFRRPRPITNSFGSMLGPVCGFAAAPAPARSLVGASPARPISPSLLLDPVSALTSLTWFESQH